jgi:hypothetical protein
MTQANPVPPPEAEETEDQRRARAAEINRKRTEEEWERNKRRWLASNFPDKAREKK